ITADDVKYTLDRIARKGSSAAVSDELSLVSGYGPAADGSADGLAGVTVTAPDTLHISLEHPWSILPEVLASPAFGVVPKEAVEAAPPSPPFGDRPVASGAFRIRARDDAHVMLERSPGGAWSHPYLDGIDVSLFGSVADSY